MKDEICARILQQLENINLIVIAVKEFSANDLTAMRPLFMIERLFGTVLQQCFVRIKDYVKIVFYLFITRTRALKNETFAFLIEEPIHSRKKGRTSTNVRK